MGALFYLPLVPCRNGHQSKRYTNSGCCYDCTQQRYGKGPVSQQQRDASIPTVVYVIEAGEFVKVGIAEDVSTRLAVLQTHCPIEARLAYTTRALPRPEARRIEAWTGYVLVDRAVRGEWFRCAADDAIAVVRDAIADREDAAPVEPPQLRLIA